MKMDDDYPSLAPLSPRKDPAQWSRMTGVIQASAAEELARRSAAADQGLVALLGDWLRPAASVSLSFAAAAAAVLVFGSTQATETLPESVADGLGYTGTVSTWLETDWTPSVEELLVAIDTEAP